MSRKAIDLTGQKFGRLTVIGRADLDGKNARWACVCECGGSAVVQSGHLRNLRTISCGCHKRTWSIKDDAVIGYAAAHRRVRVAKGPASTYPCVDCGKQAKDWSLRHDAPDVRRGDSKGFWLAFSPRPDGYEARCGSCHKNYDMTHRRTSSVA